MACQLRTSSVSAGQHGPLSAGARCLPAPRSRLCVLRAHEGASTSTATTILESLPQRAAGNIRVKLTPPRPASDNPKPPSLIHSPVYVQTALIKPGKGAAVSAPSSPSISSRGGAAAAGAEDEEGEGNGLVRALRRVDRSLDELEANPLPLQREIYQLSRGPVGTATSGALNTAAKVTMAATREAVRAAVPVGQWMVREGAKAAVSLMSRAMTESAKQQAQQGAQGQGAKQGQERGGSGGRAGAGKGGQPDGAGRKSA